MKGRKLAATDLGVFRWKLSVDDNDSLTEAITELNDLLKGRLFAIRQVLRIRLTETEVWSRTACSLDSDVRRGYGCRKAIIIPLNVDTVRVPAGRLGGQQTEITVLNSGAHLFIPVGHGLLKYYIHRVRMPAP